MDKPCNRMMSLPNPTSQILIFGCGNMGGAMLRGWISGGIAPDSFTVVDPHANDLPTGVKLHRSASEVERQFDTAILGIKPQMLAELADQISDLLAPNAMLISILAGAETRTLSKYFPNARMLRLMPNLAAAIGKSPLGLYSGQLDSDGQQALEQLLAPLGTTIWLDSESQMNAVTALAGSGPAFVYRFIDTLAKGGITLGLSPEISAKLALSMVEGAALLAANASDSPAELATRVTSPGGTTAAGLGVLDTNGALADLITATLRAASERGAELAYEAEKEKI
jgi:pyrroline-5-carboxylate reductase